MPKRNSALSELGRRTEEPPIAWLMKLALDRPKLISLAAGFTDNPSLPVEATRELLEKILGSPARGQSALQYGTGAGDAHLRELTAKRIREQDGAKPRSGAHAVDRLMMTHGSQQFLYMVSEALFDAGDRVAYPVSTYSLYDTLAELQGVEALGVPYGPNWEFPRAALEKCDARLFLICRPNAPSGTLPSIADVRSLLASRPDAVVVVDDIVVFVYVVVDKVCVNDVDVVEVVAGVVVSVFVVVVTVAVVAVVVDDVMVVMVVTAVVVVVLVAMQVPYWVLSPEIVYPSGQLS